MADVDENLELEEEDDGEEQFSDLEKSRKKWTEKKWTDADVAKKIIKRVKNLKTKNEEYEERLSELEAIMSKGTQEQPAPAEMPNGAPTQAPEAPQEQQAVSQPSNMQDLMSTQTEAIKNAMAQERQQLQVRSAQGKIQEMIRGDKDFAALADNKDGKSNEIPPEVALDIANQFDQKVAKGILKDLLTNKILHLHMENAYLKGDKAYSKWVGKLMDSKPNEETATIDAPDLSSEGGSHSSQSDDNIMEYLNNY